MISPGPLLLKFMLAMDVNNSMDLDCLFQKVKRPCKVYIEIVSGVDGTVGNNIDNLFDIFEVRKDSTVVVIQRWDNSLLNQHRRGPIH